MKVRRITTTRYQVDGPNGPWSIWDFGDELTVHDGPGLLNRVVARVRPEQVSRMTEGHRMDHIRNAAGAIHVAKLLGSCSPNFRLLWQTP